MHRALSILVVAGVAALVTMSCSGDTPTQAIGGPCPQTSAAPLGTPADFSAVVNRNAYEGGSSPIGNLSQYDLWVNVGSVAPNAGVLVPGSAAPVFRMTGSGALTPATICDVQPGDSIQVWVGFGVTRGAVESPPGTPLFDGTQVVIVGRANGCTIAIAPACDGSSLPDVPIILTVDDSLTGAPLAGSAAGTYRSGSYSHSIVSDGSDSVMIGWGVRGAYTVTITHAGYRDWVTTGVANPPDSVLSLSFPVRMAAAP